MTEKSAPKNEKHPIDVTFVVAGSEVGLKVKPDDLLSDALEKALKKSKNTGQPTEKWELKTEDGRPLDRGATFAALGLGEGSVVFATLAAGAAG